MSLDLAQLLALVVGTILPLLTGLVTKANAAAGVKAVVLLALAAVTGFLSNLVDALNTHAAFNVGSVFLTVLATFLVGVGSYFGLLKPTSLSAKVASYGVGRKPKPGSPVAK